MKYIVDEMTLEDFEKIKDILITEFDDFWSPKILKSELENFNSKYIVVADENDNIVGFGGINYNFDYVEIMNIVVKKSERGKGISNLLMKKMLLMAEEFNVNKVGLEVSSENEIAIKLYEKNGFKEVGRRKNYYNGQYDAILMDFYF